MIAKGVDVAALGGISLSDVEKNAISMFIPEIDEFMETTIVKT
ncbi:MAG: hypothetical protein ACFFCD_02050 [Promethearchaeota archaeon]